MNKCVKCGISKIQGEKIFLTEDGYCSVCNHKFRKRKRPKPYFNFKYDKDSNIYDHLTHSGTKRTKNYDKKQELYNSGKSGEIISSGHKYQQYLEKERKKQLTLEGFK